MSGDGIIKEFLVGLGFDVDKAGMASFTNGIAEASTKVAILGAAVTAAAGLVVAGISKVASEYEELHYLSQESGATVASLQEIGYVSEQMGVSAEKARASLESLGKFIEKTPGAAAMIGRFGVAAKDSNGQLRDTGDILFDLGEKLKGMPKWRQNAIAGQLGIDEDMLRVITADVGGLRNAFKEMYRVAGVDGQQAAAASREFMNELRTLGTAVGMMGKAVSIAFITRLKDDVVRLRKEFMENFAKIADIVKVFIALILRLAGFFGAMAVRIIKWTAGIVEWFQKLSEGTQTLIEVVLGLLAAWRLLNLGFLATPIGMIFAAGVAIAALVDDFQTWKEGGNSLIDWSQWAPGIEAAINGIGQIMDALAALGRALWPVLQPIVDFIGSALLATVTATFTNIIDMIRLVTALLTGDFAGAWNIVKEMASKAIDFAMGLLGNLWDTLKKVGAAMGGLFGGDKEGGAAPPPTNLAPPPSAVLMPGPATMATAGAAVAAPAGNGDVKIDQTTTIQVLGSDDPNATARSVAGAQSQVNNDMARNARRAVR